MYTKLLTAAGVFSLIILSLFAGEGTLKNPFALPELHMPQNGLPFALIEGYPNYKIVATHYRTDKNELRYILADPVAYRALQEGITPLPEGSKIVKIGWSITPMPLFPAALEAESIQRIEYMYKDSSLFDQAGDHWGYARFVKKGDAYVSWKGKINECVSCHTAAKENDYLFTNYQKTF